METKKDARNLRTQETLNRLFSLEGKTGIITGQSSGLGLAISQTLADAGATVYGFNRTVRESAEYPGVTQLSVNITDSAQTERAIAEIGNTTGIDFLINNAGITIKKPARQISAEQWRQVQATNVDSVFHLCQQAFPYLKESSTAGRIVNIASMAAHFGFTQVVPYCASKSAVLGITRGLAVEWAQDNILVNSVSPGWFPSEMNKQVLENDSARELKIMSKIPLRRYGDPVDIAAMVLFLVGASGSYITGQDFAVDGGALTNGF